MTPRKQLKSYRCKILWTAVSRTEPCNKYSWFGMMFTFKACSRLSIAGWLSFAIILIILRNFWSFFVIETEMKWILVNGLEVMFSEYQSMKINGIWISTDFHIWYIYVFDFGPFWHFWKFLDIYVDVVRDIMIRAIQRVSELSIAEDKLYGLSSGYHEAD